jgi:hypothetical protein
MRQVILFRLHKKPAICRNRLLLLKKLNPDTPIYAMYGGAKTEQRTMEKTIGRYLEGFYRIPKESGKWKWLHSDLGARLWFKSVGHKVKFDRMHLIEWDLLTLKPLKQLYGNLSNNTVALTGLKPLHLVEKSWYWTTHEPYKSQWHQLLEWAKKEHRYKATPYSCLGPGASLPRTFLEHHAKINVPELVHDELRLPLFSQIFGLKLKDTGFHKRTATPGEHFYFNCHNHPISIETIKRELKKPNGRRAFHPYRAFFDAGLVRPY